MRLPTLSALLLLLVAPAALAHNGWTHCGGTEIVATGSHYIVYDTVGPNAGWAWFYLETNGIIDLQRGGTDWCQEVPDADSGYLLF